MSWLLWKIQEFFQSKGIKAELLVVLCISDSESPLLQPTATGSGSKAGSRSHLPVCHGPLLPLLVPEPLNRCPAADVLSVTAKKLVHLSLLRQLGKERVISYCYHTDRDHTRKGKSPDALSRQNLHPRPSVQTLCKGHQPPASGEGRLCAWF